MSEKKQPEKLVVMPKSSIEAIYEFIVSRPAKEVLQVLKHFEKVRLAEETQPIDDIVQDEQKQDELK